jgi:hypothetical protein
MDPLTRLLSDYTSILTARETCRQHRGILELKGKMRADFYHQISLLRSWRYLPRLYGNVLLFH